MARSRGTIGENPLDAVIPAPTEAKRGKRSRAEVHPEPEKPPRVAKERLTIHLPTALCDRLRDCVFWEPGLTLAGMAEEALGRAVDQLEKKRGEPYPPRKGQLKAGRPVG